MIKKGSLFVLGIFFLVVGVGFVGFGIASDTSIFNADIYDSNPPLPMISIQVPDRVYLGNVTEGDISSEMKVYLNNTGNVDVVVRPELKNASEKIMSNLYFREQKTKTVNGTSVQVPFQKIGDFSFNITKPLSGQSYNDKYVYLILNLTSINISQNYIDYEAEVRFVAVPA